MNDVRMLELAARQHRCVARAQLEALGYSQSAIRHRVEAGRLVRLREAVFAVAPVVAGDERARWMAATLTTPRSVLSHASAAAAFGFRAVGRTVEAVTRPGDGGPERRDGVLVFRSRTLAGEATTLHGIPITQPERTIIDLAPVVSDRALARLVREAIRLETTTVSDLFAALRRHRGRRGTRRVDATVARYAGVPVGRTRSDAEVLALELLRDAGRPRPDVNRRIAGEEADLSWPRERRIIEIDGAPFHLDAAEDARRQRAWEAAGWTVHRVASDDLYLQPERLLAIAPAPAPVAGAAATAPAPPAAPNVDRGTA